MLAIRRSRVHSHSVTGYWRFQTERGIAASMVHLLQYLRDGVQLVDGAAGHYADVLLCPPADCALVVFEARRYSRHAQLLCRKAREAGIEVTLVTDTSSVFSRPITKTRA